MTIKFENNILSIAVIFIAAFNLLRLVKRNALATAQGGFHTNLLIFYGLGPLCYGIAEIYWDTRVRKIIPIYINKVQWAILMSYLAGTIIFYIIDRRKKALASAMSEVLNREKNVNRLTSLILILSVVGYTFSGSEISLSGIGTVFVVLKNLLFPGFVLLIFNASLKDRLSLILLFCGFMIVGINTFLSQWRSEFIVFLFSICTGLVLRNRRFLWLGLLLAPILFILVLPFQQLKKSGKIKDADYINAITTSITSKVSPMDMATSFIAYRMNYGRESAYVLRGIDKKYISLKYGETYVETFTQLIPRVFWPGKPSYNRYSGYILPRKIGLTAKIDKQTSWAVNYFAEFLYNFEIKFLPIFFLLYWIILRWFDKLSNTMQLLPEVKVILQFALFFQVLAVVSVINAATYFLWLFLILKFINSFLQMKDN